MHSKCGTKRMPNKIRLQAIGLKGLMNGGIYPNAMSTKMAMHR